MIWNRARLRQQQSTRKHSTFAPVGDATRNTPGDYCCNACGHMQCSCGRRASRPARFAVTLGAIVREPQYADSKLIGYIIRPAYLPTNIAFAQKPGAQKPGAPIALKPCALCGAPALLKATTPAGRARIDCTQCDRCAFGQTLPDAALAWNAGRERPLHESRIAAYRSECKACGHWIMPGEHIVDSREHGHYVHRNCAKE